MVMWLTHGRTCARTQAVPASAGMPVRMLELLSVHVVADVCEEQHYDERCGRSAMRVRVRMTPGRDALPGQALQTFACTLAEC